MDQERARTAAGAADEEVVEFVAVDVSHCQPWPAGRFHMGDEVLLFEIDVGVFVVPPGDGYFCCLLWG
ncbi:hypothetical protein ACQ86N_29520 [Puia sp. P3]|uniref:hypothetical protein n=1 Tax=Puia sp. P3 TaxID=3423952 RepID=UPI003D671EE5